MSADHSLVVDGFDIRQLSDDELYTELCSRGATVGPVFAATRKVYQRKLAVLMGSVPKDYSITEEPNSESDVDAEPTQAYIDSLERGAPRRRKPDLNRSNITQEHFEDEYDGLHNQSYSSPPTATSYSLTSSPPRSQPSSPVKPPLVEEQEDSQDSGLIQLIFKIALLAVIAIVFYYVFLAKPEKDAFDKLEQMASTAANAMKKEGAKAAHNHPGP